MTKLCHSNIKPKFKLCQIEREKNSPNQPHIALFLPFSSDSTSCCARFMISFDELKWKKCWFSTSHSYFMWFLVKKQNYTFKAQIGIQISLNKYLKSYPIIHYRLNQTIWLQSNLAFVLWKYTQKQFSVYIFYKNITQSKLFTIYHLRKSYFHVEWVTTTTQVGFIVEDE